jgi:parallel beta-helix repeat protein
MNRLFLFGTFERARLSFLASAILLLAIANASWAGTVCVNPKNASCAPSISQGVFQALAGDTVSVAPGTYTEEVVITKPITLAGSGKQGKAVTIDATGLPHAIYITGVTGPMIVQQITAANALREGILIENSSNITVKNSTVMNNDKSLAFGPPTCSPSTIPCCPGAFPFEQEDCGEGIHLLGTSYSLVANNLVQNNQGGILLTDETGPTSNNFITGNLVQNNATDCGITLPSHPPCVQTSTDATGCKGGPNIGAASPGVFANSVIGNTSFKNGGAGVGIFAPTPGTAAYGNLVANNVLQKNGLPGVALHSHAPAQNLNSNAIVSNLISGNGPDDGSTQTTGIALFSDNSAGAAPLTEAPVYGNSISAEDVDIFVGTSANNITVSYNNLGGTGLGILNVGSGIVNAPGNYWNCPEGPTSASCSHFAGNVNFTPSLTKRFDPRSLNKKQPPVD